jgi:hypothetical protein
MDNQQPNTNPHPAPASTPQSGNFLKQMEDFFNTYLHKKVPFHLPPNVKEWIVKYSPWITLVVMLLALPVVLAAFSITAFFSPFMAAYGVVNHTWYLVSGLIALVALVMEAAALPGLFGRKLSGWHLVYYSVLVSAIGQIIGGEIISMIINVAISMYFLFEIREYYK